ncbi:MAG: hypothetical protein ACR2FG_15405 [Marmoricola sp.]
MGTPKPPSPPAGAQQAGRRLWRAVVGDYELDEHELTLLRQAVRVADLCDRLQVEVEDGPLLSEGRVHPAVVELRQQQIVLARLVVALQIPIGLTAGEDRTQRRGARGVYKMRAVS